MNLALESQVGYLTVLIVSPLKALMVMTDEMNSLQKQGFNAKILKTKLEDILTEEGDVSNPGNYALPSLATVYTALYAAGGPSESGTFREIRLVRDNKQIAKIDIYSFLTSGIR